MYLYVQGPIFSFFSPLEFFIKTSLKLGHFVTFYLQDICVYYNQINILIIQKIFEILLNLSSLVFADSSYIHKLFFDSLNNVIRKFKKKWSKNFLIFFCIFLPFPNVKMTIKIDLKKNFFFITNFIV
ncbi:hypothetical protein Mgra_00005279 [Meloidogyne graminicola]|uniref:Uncharacterized protein n=1 Tax=Meloidogyne graminicola TaxID=189291 RepID=A0A8S9ZPX6_9BILA|nr:hypothetical protein Mgra_00005279 [Meloidogyne graminicola]